MEKSSKKVANYIEDKQISILSNEPEFYVALIESGYLREVCHLMYDSSTNSVSHAYVKDANIPEGFERYLIKPISRLLQKNNGDFNANDFDPIHDAIKKTDMIPKDTQYPFY